MQRYQRIHFTDVEIPDGLWTSPRRTLPQCGQPCGRVTLTWGSVNRTWAAGTPGVLCILTTLSGFPAVFMSHRLWDGYVYRAELLHIQMGVVDSPADAVVIEG